MKNLLNIFNILIILIIICIIIAVVLISKNKVKELIFEQKEIPKFSVDLQFDPYPQTVNIENKYDCNIKSLRTCDIHDSTTLFGCKELIVRCHHFEEDTPYIENNETTIIPKNSKPEEGYALAITAIAQACNPYHGDMTLVAADADSTEYMLVCSCKNPGYIGNESLLDNCTSVFICDGKIDNLDQPLKNINCLCDEREKTVRYEDGLPVCKDLLVHEANEMYSDWSNIIPWNSYRQMSTSNFNVTISGNLKTSRLLDPCRNSIHDTTVEVPDASFNTLKNQCQLRGYGFPVVNGLLRYTQATDVDKKDVGISAVLATGAYDRIRFSDNISGERKIFGLVIDGLPFVNDFNSQIVVHPPNGIGLSMQNGISFDSKSRFVGPTCYDYWPTYDCDNMTDRASFFTDGLAFPNGRRCPTMFLWSRGDWEDHEFLIARSFGLDTRGIKMSAIKLANIDSLHTYGVQWSAKTSDEYTGLLTFANKSDYNIHKNTLTN